MDKERCKELLIKAIEASINICGQTTVEILRAMEITSDELKELGFEVTEEA